MMNPAKPLVAVLTFLLLLPGALMADQHMPFGDGPDVEFSQRLWQALVEARLVGDERINVQPFKGNEPHGSIQQVLAHEVTVDGRRAEVLVKHIMVAKGSA